MRGITARRDTCVLQVGTRLSRWVGPSTGVHCAGSGTDTFPLCCCVCDWGYQQHPDHLLLIREPITDRLPDADFPLIISSFLIQFLGHSGVST